MCAMFHQLDSFKTKRLVYVSSEVSSGGLTDTHIDGQGCNQPVGSTPVLFYINIKQEIITAYIRLETTLNIIIFGILFWAGLKLIRLMLT